MTREQKLEKLGYAVDRIPTPAANYQPVVVEGGIAYVSGCIPFDGPGNLVSTGRLGLELDLERGREAAALCAANVLRVVRAELGSLECITRVIRLAGYVASSDTFTDQHLVMNAASDLMLNVLGDAGHHSRSAVGVAQLPLGASVEIDAILSVSMGSGNEP